MVQFSFQYSMFFVMKRFANITDKNRFETAEIVARTKNQQKTILHAKTHSEIWNLQTKIVPNSSQYHVVTAVGLSSHWFCGLVRQICSVRSFLWTTSVYRCKWPVQPVHYHRHRKLILGGICRMLVKLFYIERLIVYVILSFCREHF